MVVMCASDSPRSDRTADSLLVQLTLAGGRCEVSHAQNQQPLASPGCARWESLPLDAAVAATNVMSPNSTAWISLEALVVKVPSL